MSLGHYILLIGFVLTLVLAVVSISYSALKDTTRMRLRAVAIFALFFTLFSALCAHIFQIQYVEGDEILARQKDPVPDTIPALRGNILSDDGQLLATSQTFYKIFLDTRAEGLRKIEKNNNPLKWTYFERNVAELSDSLHALCDSYTAAQYQVNLRKAYNEKRKYYRILKKDLTYLEYLRAKQFPILRKGPISGGVNVVKSYQRIQPFRPLANRTIGGIYGKDSRGKNGLEMQYDSLLHGSNGLKVTRKIGKNRVNLILKQPTDGYNIVSTINIDIQETTDRALRAALDSFKADCGTAILMETATGHIKAISNLTLQKDGRYTEATNIAFGSLIEPGSTFKAVSCLVLLEDQKVDTCEMVDTGNGIKTFYKREMKDSNWRNGGHGRISLAESFHCSSNIGICTLVDRHYHKHPEQFIAGIRRIGLCDSIGLDIPGHGYLHIKTPGTKGWSETTLPWFSIGYECQVPPIYMLMFYNAIANQGCMVKPMLVSEIRNGSKTIEKKEVTVINASIASSSTIHKLQKMMEGVVTRGTGRRVASKLFPIAGKTGTSQISINGKYHDEQGHAMVQITFCGYFPANNPQYSCLVYIRNPRVTTSAGVACGSVFRQIAECAYLQRNRIQPSDLENSENEQLLVQHKLK